MVLHAGEGELLGAVVFSCSKFIFSIFVLLLFIDFYHAILHEDQVCILIGPLLSLALLNSFVKEIYSLFVLLFQLSLYALILHVLQSIHLELLDWVTNPHLVLRLSHLPEVACVPCGVCQAHILFHLIRYFLRCLPLLCKLDVIFVKYNFLNIMCWHLPHE